MCFSPHGGRKFVAGACVIPDRERERAPLVTAHWVYAPAKQGASQMQRVGVQP